MSYTPDQIAHQLIRAKGLEDKNVSQAGKIMEYAHDYSMLMKRFEEWQLEQDVWFKIFKRLEIQYIASMRLNDIYKELLRKNMDTKPKEDNTVPFVKLRLLKGGTDGDSNWLLSLPVGSVFLTREFKSESAECIQFEVRNKWGRGVWLTCTYPGNGRSDFWDSHTFVKKFELIDILREGPAPEVINED